MLVSGFGLKCPGLAMASVPLCASNKWPRDTRISGRIGRGPHFTLVESLRPHSGERLVTRINTGVPHLAFVGFENVPAEEICIVSSGITGRLEVPTDIGKPAASLISKAGSLALVTDRAYSILSIFDGARDNSTPELSFRRVAHASVLSSEEDKAPLWDIIRSTAMRSGARKSYRPRANRARRCVGLRARASFSRKLMRPLERS